MKKIFFFVIFFSAFCLGIVKADAATMYLSPSTGSVEVGQEFSVQVIVNEPSAEVIGADAIITYDPALLQHIQTTQGTMFSNPAYTIPAVSGGTIRITGTDSSSGDHPFTGSNGLFATIRFRALTTGTAHLNFTFTQGATNDTNVSEKDTAVDLLTSVTNGTYNLVVTDDDDGELPRTAIYDQVNAPIIFGVMLIVLSMVLLIKTLPKPKKALENS